MQNYCSRGGHLETSKGKYTDFRPLGVSFYKPSKVGGCVGALGYCMLSGCNDPETGNGVLKLSGDAAPLKEAVKQLSAKTGQFKWSIAIDSESDCYAYNVDPEKIEDVYADDGKTISATIVGLKQPIASDTLGKFKPTEAEMLALWENQVEYEEDNCFYCPTVPEAGNQLVPLFYSVHAEGCMSRAIQRAAHAEGRSCLADGRYSHAEGMNTIACNIAAHSEGWNTFAQGHYSHAEGYSSSALAKFAHAEGGYGSASGVCSHVEGSSCITKGRGAHAEGNGCKAIGEYSHAENVKAQAAGNGSHAAGYSATAQGTYSYVWNGIVTSQKYGQDKMLSGDGIYALNPVGGINGFYIGT